MRLRLIPTFLTAIALAPPSIAQAPVARLRAVEEMRIDGSGHEFTSIARVVVLPTGEVAFVGQGDTRIDFFGRDGSRSGTFGRDGAGPGEFRMIVFMGTVGDTLWIGDVRLNRVTLVGPDRQLLRSFAAPRVVARPERSRDDGAPAPMVVASGLRSGGFVGAVFLEAGAQIPEWLPTREGSIPIVQLSPDGSFRHLVAWWRTSTECRAPFSSGSGRGSFEVPFCATPLRHHSQDAAYFAFLEQRNVEGIPERFGVVLVRTNGDTLYQRTIGYTAVPVSRKAADSALTRIRNFRGGPFANGLPPEAMSAIESIRIPSTHPPAHAIVAGLDGVVWLGLERGEPGYTWLALLPDGTTLGELQLPRNVRVVNATATMLWAVETDDDGVPSVVRYRVVR